MKPSIILFSFLICFVKAQITSFQEVGNLPLGLQEISGSVFYNQSIYALNDSGGSTQLIEINPQTAELIREIDILGATNVDWEAMSMDETHIYIGDIGNNAGNRQDLTIYKIQKSEMAQSSISAESFVFSYSDQINFENEFQNHNFDAEAMIVIGDSIYIFSKNWVDQQTKVYAIAKDGSQSVANLVAEIEVNTLVTDACYDAPSNQLVLIGYSEMLQPKTIVFPNFNTSNISNNTFETYALPIDFGTVLQTESVSYLGDNTYAVGNEYYSTVVAGINIISEARLHTFTLNSTLQIAPSIPSIETTIYPNPSKDFISIAISNSMQIENIYIYNLYGIAQNITMDSNQIIDIQSLERGIYYLQFLTNQGIQTQKFIKY